MTARLEKCDTNALMLDFKANWAGSCWVWKRKLIDHTKQDVTLRIHISQKLEVASMCDFFLPLPVADDIYNSHVFDSFEFYFVAAQTFISSVIMSYTQGLSRMPLATILHKVNPRSQWPARPELIVSMLTYCFWVCRGENTGTDAEHDTPSLKK